MDSMQHDTLIGASAWSASVSSFALILVAELGDKSQLVCMTLATRHRAWPVFAGATLAFMGLNLLAVVFGAGIAAWLPRLWLGLGVGLLFVAFGIQALRQAEVVDSTVAEVDNRRAHGPFLTTLVLISLAELGDKTQLSVAGLSSAAPALAVWVGATTALALTTALAVWLGAGLLRRIPLVWLHRIAGVLFILIGLLILAGALTGGDSPSLG